MLKSLEAIERALEERPGQLAQAKEKGARVMGYFCNYVPEEVIYAGGFIPLRLCCKGTLGEVETGSAYLTSASCPFARSIVGIMEKGENPYYKAIDYLVDSPSCIMVEWAIGVWEKYFGIQIIPLGVPHKVREAHALEYYEAEIEWFKKEVEKLSGQPLTQEALREAIELYNSIRLSLEKIYQSLLYSPQPLSWKEALRVVHAGFLLDRKQYLSLLKDVLREIDSTSSQEIDEDEPKILLAGSILAPGDEALLEAVEGSGLKVVMDEFCTGSRWFMRQVEGEDLKALASRYLLKTPCATMPFGKEEEDLRLAQLRKFIEELNIQGVIFYTLKFCDPYGFKTTGLRQYLEKLNVPMLHLDSDYSSTGLGQIKTRVEAFMEMIY